MPQQPILSRKSMVRHTFLWTPLILLVASLIVACASPVSTTNSAGKTPTAVPSATTQGQAPIATSTCSGTPTPSQTEGPYYKSGSPERTSLQEAGLSGTPLLITGYVFSTKCQPIAH